MHARRQWRLERPPQGQHVITRVPIEVAVRRVGDSLVVSLVEQVVGIERHGPVIIHAHRGTADISGALQVDAAAYGPVRSPGRGQSYSARHAAGAHPVSGQFGPAH